MFLLDWGKIKVLLKQDEHDVLMDDKSLSNAVLKSKFGHSGVNRFNINKGFDTVQKPTFCTIMFGR